MSQAKLDVCLNYLTDLTSCIPHFNLLLYINMSLYEVDKLLTQLVKVHGVTRARKWVCFYTNELTSRK